MHCAEFLRFTSSWSAILRRGKSTSTFEPSVGGRVPFRKHCNNLWCWTFWAVNWTWRKGVPLHPITLYHCVLQFSWNTLFCTLSLFVTDAYRRPSRIKHLLRGSSDDCKAFVLCFQSHLSYMHVTNMHRAEKSLVTFYLANLYKRFLSMSHFYVYSYFDFKRFLRQYSWLRRVAILGTNTCWD